MWQRPPAIESHPPWRQRSATSLRSETRAAEPTPAAKSVLLLPSDYPHPPSGGPEYNRKCLWNQKTLLLQPRRS